MIDPWDQPVYFVGGSYVTEKQFREYLRSQGQTPEQINDFFKEVRRMRENLD